MQIPSGELAASPPPLAGAAAWGSGSAISRQQRTVTATAPQLRTGTGHPSWRSSRLPARLHRRDWRLPGVAAGGSGDDRTTGSPCQDAAMATALLLVDVQRNMLEGNTPVPAADQVRPALQSLLARARTAGALVV